MRWWNALLLGVALLGLLAAPAAAAGTDTDGDGLSDYWETHKYRTDPAKADSDGDGVPDGDWHERREYTYSIRLRPLVLGPCSVDQLTDDFQDVRLVRSDERTTELEVVLYPASTCQQNLVGRQGWRADVRDMGLFLKSRPASGFDRELARALRMELAGVGIKPDVLTDVEFARRASRYLRTRGRPLSGSFTTYFTRFDAEGTPVVQEGAETAFKEVCDRWSRSPDEQFARDVVGAEMLKLRTYGACTSYSIYSTSGLRALGLPTRIIVGVPVIDASLPAQWKMLRDGIAHDGVRDFLQRAAAPMRDAFASHTYQEVFVGGRWVRLNYDKLGPPAFDQHCMGLLVHVHTFLDWSESGLPQTWGVRYAQRSSSVALPGKNPYRAMAISDSMGPHADPAAIELPRPRRPVRAATATKLMWYFSEDRPGHISSPHIKDDGWGHVLLFTSGAENATRAELRALYAAATAKLTLFRTGEPPVPLVRGRGFWGATFHLKIKPDDLARMQNGAVYTLRGFPDARVETWTVKHGVTLSRR